jgi:hypothetical protein
MPGIPAASVDVDNLAWLALPLFATRRLVTVRPLFG